MYNKYCCFLAESPGHFAALYHTAKCNSCTVTKTPPASRRTASRRIAWCQQHKLLPNLIENENFSSCSNEAANFFCSQIPNRQAHQAKKKAKIENKIQQKKSYKMEQQQELKATAATEKRQTSMCNCRCCRWQLKMLATKQMAKFSTNLPKWQMEKIKILLCPALPTNCDHSTVCAT